jgi:signal transduction histidine kinase
MRRMAVVAAVLLGLSAIGTGTVVSWLMQQIAGPPGPIRNQLSAILLVALVLALMLVISFFTVMRRVGSPLGDLVAAAGRVGAGDYEARVIERGPPFLRLVARSFNSMTIQLQAQDRQRRQLMADIAHELRTPLSVIQGRLEGLLDGVYPRDDERIAGLLEETRMLARLVEDLRTLANAEAGSLPLRKEPTDLGVLLHDAVGSFAAEAQAKGIDLRIDDGDELPLLEIDPLRIREVLTNLLANAIRHTGAGGTITVAARVREGGRVEVSVRDTGSGIPAEELPKIFDRFYKGSTSRGSGLGLTIARNLVAAHGGEIAAESEVGRGTLIRFTLGG